MFDLSSRHWLKKAAYCFLGALLAAILLETLTPNNMYGGSIIPGSFMPGMVMNGSNGDCSNRMRIHGQHMSGYFSPIYNNLYYR